MKENLEKVLKDITFDGSCDYDWKSGFCLYHFSHWVRLAY